MTNSTHNLISFASLFSAFLLFPPTGTNLTTLGLSLTGNIIGGNLPDIDQASNRLWDLLPLGNQVGKIFKGIFMGHRNLTHSILGVYLVYRLLGYLLPFILNAEYIDNNMVIGSIMIGYLAHLVADGITEEGLPLLFPLKYKFGFPPIRSWRIKTGKWFEKYVIFPLVSVYIAFLFLFNFDLIKIFLGNIF